MIEPVFYIRGMPRTPLNQTAIADLAIVAAIPQEAIQPIWDELAKVTGFLNPGRLKNLVSRHLSGDQALAVSRVLKNIEPNNIKRVLEYLDGFRKDPQNQEILNEDLYNKLTTILPELIRPLPALERYKKAELLSKATGQELGSFDIYCDLRPVFDEKRETVEGMFPIFTMKVIVEGVDGLPVSVETNLTLAQIREMVEITQKAETKAKTLMKKVDSWIPNGLPKVSTLRQPRKDQEEPESDE